MFTTIKSKLMKYNWLLFLGILAFLTSCSLPKSITSNWEGKMVYSLHSDRFSPNREDSINYQIVYAKDSLLRIDSYTGMGKQIYLENLDNGKSWILLGYGSKKFAIEIEPDSTNKKMEGDGYILKHKAGKKLLGGIEAKNISVYDTILDTTIVMNYYPEISSKYATAFNSFPGLPVSYAIYTKGMWINYHLKSLQKRPVDIHKFIIPDAYEIVTLHEFMDIIQGR